MKTNRCFLLILIMSIILAACAPSRTPAPPALALPPSAAPTDTLAPTLTPTLTPTPVPTASPTRTRTQTPTPLPRLDFETNLTLQEVFECLLPGWRF